MLDVHPQWDVCSKKRKYKKYEGDIKRKIYWMYYRSGVLALGKENTKNRKEK